MAGSRPHDQRVVIFGAGTAGVGVADQIRAVMVDDGLSDAQATRRFWCVDRQGLLVDDMSDLRDFQMAYARPRSELGQWRIASDDGSIGLADVVANVHPTILVGTSTQGGAFTEAIVRDMAANTDRPMIFPLSNPTELIEAVPSDVIYWTDGRGLVGTGTPWAPVPYDGVDYEIGQANNALIYPGIGLGTIVSRARAASPTGCCSRPPRRSPRWSTPAAPGRGAPKHREPPQHVGHGRGGRRAPGHRKRESRRLISPTPTGRSATRCGPPRSPRSSSTDGGSWSYWLSISLRVALSTSG